MSTTPKTITAPFHKIRRNLSNAFKHHHLILAVLALIIGISTGCAIIALREGIGWIQWVYYSTNAERFYLEAFDFPWWLLILGPTVGGLVVGLFIKYTLPDERSHGIADVIEAYARRSGYMSLKTGIAAAVASAASIGCGASAGREGPAVHLGASLAGWLTRRLHLPRNLSRTVLGCGVSAAVAASFNAPIAGALFAGEVIVGHYALRSFAPIVIASVAGTVLTRSWFGDFPAFAISDTIFASVWEFPAFVLLGIVSAVAAMTLMHSIRIAGVISKKIPSPQWTHPAIAGFCIGIIALAFPQVMGVGYGTTESAMLLEFGFWMLVGIGVAKIAATALTLGFGFAGGIFSPALVLGAMVGSSYGILATSVFPNLSSGPDAYTLIGMGAVAAAVLGAPISTTLIIFELTGDYALTLGVMIAVVTANEVTDTFFGKSFFDMQLSDRGIDLNGEFETEALQACLIGDVMDKTIAPINIDTPLCDVRTGLQSARIGKLFLIDTDGFFHGTVNLSDLGDKAFNTTDDGDIKARDIAYRSAPFLSAEDDLSAAMELMHDTGVDHIAVIVDMETMKFAGCLHRVDAMTAYNRTLAQQRHEEHG